MFLKNLFKLIWDFFRVADARQHIADEVLKEATNNIGMGMTYTLFEWVKENLDQLAASQPEKLVEAISSKLVISDPTVKIQVLKTLSIL